MVREARRIWSTFRGRFLLHYRLVTVICKKCNEYWLDIAQEQVSGGEEYPRKYRLPGLGDSVKSCRE